MIALMPTDLQDGVASLATPTLGAEGPQPTPTEDDGYEYGNESDDGAWDGVTTIQNDSWGTAAQAQAQATQGAASQEAEEEGYSRYRAATWGRRMVKL